MMGLSISTKPVSDRVKQELAQGLDKWHHALWKISADEWSSLRAKYEQQVSEQE
jgi:hypothetical protein